MELVHATQKQYLEELKSLYLEAFPKAERKPFSMLLQMEKEGIVEILAVIDEEQTFCGLAIMAFYEDLALLDYFAVSANQRDRGIGSITLGLLKERYKEKRFFLEIEDPAVEASNKEERIRRKAFYLRNGMIPTSLVVDLFGIQMEILTFGQKIEYQEYHRLYEQFGKEIADKIHLIP